MSTTISSPQLERIPVNISDDPAELSRLVAMEISDLIRERKSRGENVVLGLPTGSTPIGVYHELVRMHREDGLSFVNVITFNLDEYYPMQPDSLQSYHRFMRENFFDHVDVPEENIHIPRGDIEPSEVDDHCAEYERLIQQAGGIDLIMLGIGRSGHIGFNEPGSHPEDRTRLIVLDEITRKDAASDFFEEKYVPQAAITMGVGTILESRRIILMATGEHKAPIIKRAVEEPESSDVSATYLQRHPNAIVYLDKAVASELTHEKTPWCIGSVKWDDDLAKRAVIWLARKTGKAIAELDVSDFHRNHLHELVHAYGDTDELCQSILENLREKIHYRSQLPTDQRIIVFSPHPDDDVISMGGMLAKLVVNDNEIVVAYMTNGSVAVFDQDVRRHLRFSQMVREDIFHEYDDDGAVSSILEFLGRKKPAQVDTDEVQRIKAYIRYTEAVAAIEIVGLGVENARFLDLPFYKTGRVRKDPVSQADIDIIVDLLNEIVPEHIFVAGDLSDPHGTHRMCYGAVEQALEVYNRDVADDHPKPKIWLYRGAWQEWEIDRVDVFVPLSKADLDRKIEAVFKHESQKDRALFPGAYDEREFWQRARDRNRETAEKLDELGLPRFYAVEAYVTVDEMP